MKQLFDYFDKNKDGLVDAFEWTSTLTKDGNFLFKIFQWKHVADSLIQWNFFTNISHNLIFPLPTFQLENSLKFFSEYMKKTSCTTDDLVQRMGIEGKDELDKKTLIEGIRCLEHSLSYDEIAEVADGILIGRQSIDRRDFIDLIEGFQGTKYTS